MASRRGEAKLDADTESRPGVEADAIDVSLATSPAPTPLPVKFRHAPGAHRTRLTFDERRYLREARRVQQVMQWLVRELREGRPSIPAYTLQSDVEQAGQSLALYVQREGHDVRIITEDITTTPRKTALTDAAGLFGIGCVRFRTFLICEAIWDGREGT